MDPLCFQWSTLESNDKFQMVRRELFRRDPGRCSSPKGEGERVAPPKKVFWLRPRNNRPSVDVTRRQATKISAVTPYGSRRICERHASSVMNAWATKISIPHSSGPSFASLHGVLLSRPQIMGLRATLSCAHRLPTTWTLTTLQNLQRGEFTSFTAFLFSYLVAVDSLPVAYGF